jgi:hypothetical protein
MVRRIALVLSTAALALSFGVGPADARDTGWDCPGCKVRTR